MTVPDYIKRLKVYLIRNSMTCSKTMKTYRKYIKKNKFSTRLLNMYLVGISNAVLSGIKDDEFM